MDSSSSDVATKVVKSGVSGALQYLNPDYMPPSLDSKNSPLAMLARTCNSIGKDPTPSKPAHQSQQQQQPAGEKKDGSHRLIKSSSPGKKAAAGVDGVTSRKDQSSTSSSTLSRQSAAVGGRTRSSTSPSLSRLRHCRDSGRRGDSRWSAVNDGGPALSSGGSPASTSKTADSDRDSVDDAAATTTHSGCHERQQRRRPLSPFCSSEAQPSVGLYESLRLQQEAAALHAAVYSPLHQLMAQRHFIDPLAMYSASIQAAAVVAAAAQANLGHPAGQLAAKDSTFGAYRLGDILKPCGVDTVSGELVGNGDVDNAVFGAAGGLPLRLQLPPLGHQQPYVCSWLVAGGEFCAQRFSTSAELFAHLRTHVVDGAEDPMRSSFQSVPSGSAFAPTVGGLLGAALPIAGPFAGGGSTASLAAAQAAATFYRSKLHRPTAGRSSLDAASTSPTSSTGSGGSLLLQAAAEAAAAAGSSSRYHPYKWTPSPFVASQLSGAVSANASLPISELAAPAPPALNAFLQHPPYGGLLAQTLGATVP